MSQSISRPLSLLRFGRLVLCALAICLVPPAVADEVPAPDREKKIYAHHMGSLNVGRGAMAWHAENPELGDPRFSNGGDYRSLALAPREVNRLSYEESADLQIRRAMAIGIDGFAVNAWAGGADAQAFVDALFRVAEENDYPFEIGLCPDIATIEQPNGYLIAVVEAIRDLLAKHGDSPKLARRDGKPIVFGYQSVFLWVDYLRGHHDDEAEIDRLRTTPEGWATIHEAFDLIETLVGEELFFQFEMNAFFHGVRLPVASGLQVSAAAAVARQFPAVNQFLPNQYTMEIARAVLAEGAEWGHPVLFQYDNNRTNTVLGGPGTAELRQRWQEARELGSTMIHYTTWNDYQESTNLSPATNTRYAVYDLSGYFIEWWKTGAPPALERERVYLFSRKYGSEAEVFPFRAHAFRPGAIEVLTILDEPAVVIVPGRAEPYRAPAGMHARQFPVTPGPVRVELRREEQVNILTLPDPVTERPFRQDNAMVAISSECHRYWQEEFGQAAGLMRAEYGDDDGDGLPNWFEMYWFGKYNDFSTATLASPGGVANEAGLTNLEAYRQQKNPHDPDWDPIPREGPFRGRPGVIPGLIQAEDFDYGGQGVAYYDTVPHNQGGAYRLDEAVDIETAIDTIGSYNVGNVVEGEWLEYTVEVRSTGLYDISARVASESRGGQMRILIDGVDVTGPMIVPVTRGWQEWRTITAPSIQLEEGIRKMRVKLEATEFNLNYIEILETVVLPPRTYEAWALEEFGLVGAGDPGVGGKAADPDGDGIPNLLEYALGGDPLQADRGRLPTFRLVEEDGKTFALLEFIRPAGLNDLAYFVEVADAPPQWIVATDAIVEMTEVSAGRYEIVTARDRTPLTARRHRFLRLRVEAD